MGATVTSGKKSAAFVRDDGTVIYILFERTYEKNCHPHSPRWGCIAIGEYPDVMKRVFGHASACEGGSLQGEGGRTILPENYISAWRREIASSTRLHNQSIELQVGNSYRSTIHADKLDAIRLALVQIGRDDVISAIQAGKATISLHDDSDVVLAIYGVDKFIAPWTILTCDNCTNVPAPELAPKAVISSIEQPMPCVFRLDGEELMGRFASEPYRCLGWEYSAVAAFINEVAYHLEMKQTGCSKRLIADFREQCRNAQSVPSSSLVTITREVDGNDAWYVETFDKLARKLGVVAEGQPLPTSFQCVFADVLAKDAIYPFKYLRDNQVKWDVQADAAQTVQHARQLDLLVAA